MAISPLFYGASPAALAVEGLTFSAGGVPILSDLSFGVEPGAMLAVVGPNGAGKSSLLRCLYRFNRPAGGLVRLDGQDIWSLGPRQFARRVATVLQEPAGDFGLTAAEVVELGLIPHGGRAGGRALRRRAVYDAVYEALALMKLEQLASRSFASLSGGEKQRVLIAKALMQRPDLLILDEPTNHLDIRHQLDILALISDLPATVVVSLHDLSLAAAHADRVLVINQGQAVEWGPALRVLTPELIRGTFAVETVVDRHPATGRPRYSFHVDP